MHHARALSDLRVWMCHLCSLVDAPAEKAGERRSVEPLRTNIPPLPPIAATARQYRLG